MLNIFNKSIWVVEDNNIKEKVMKHSKNIRIFYKESFIYQQEDKRDYLYFLIEGRVSVGISSTNGSEKTLAIHEPGSFFGETAFFDEYPSFSYAKALKNSTVIVIDREQFMNMIKDNPEIAYNLFNSISRKIRLLVYQVEYLSFYKIEERLISLLITLFLTVGKQCSNDNKEKFCNSKNLCNSNNGYILDLTITDQEIGDMISARREAVTRAINNLKNQGLIHKNKRTICCPDISLLEEILSNVD